jgi:hypothetical protein
MPGDALSEAGWRLYGHIPTPVSGNKATAFGRFAVHPSAGKVEEEVFAKIEAIQPRGSGTNIRCVHEANDGLCNLKNGK